MNNAQPFNAHTLPLNGLRLIEASAGTGKTFSLAGLYLRLIVEKRVSVRDILVMTFTRAATQELRERIRARLADAARMAYTPELADADNPEHNFALQVINEQDEDRPQLARRLADAAARLDEATIVTIHGFSQRAATENAFESALAFDRGEQVDDNAVQHEVTTDYWREQVFGASANPDLLALWPTPAALYQAIKPVLGKPYARTIGGDRGLLRDKLSELCATWPNTPAALTQALDAAMEAGALKNSNVQDQLTQFDSPADYVADLDKRISHAIETGETPVLDQAIAELGTPKKFINQQGKAKKACGDAFAQIPALPTLAELVPLAHSAMIDTAVATIRRRVTAHKLQHRQYSFSDLIQALHDALHNPNTGAQLADALYERWPYALVDEFQDTDPLQYASLRRIYLDRPRDDSALLLIGDPKQAIYGFRGGDIYAYLAAAQMAGHERRYTLTTNFRSTQAVLDAIEALYRLPGSKPFVVPEIDFPTVKAGRLTGDKMLVTTADEYPALTFWSLYGGEKENAKGKRTPPRKEDNTAHLMTQTVARIGELLNGQSTWWQTADGSQTPVAARDIAVLVNNHFEATQLQAQLAHSGIMAVCQHRDSVFDTEQAQDLRFILRAMAAPDDATAIRAAQTTSLIGKRLSDLIQLADDDGAMQQAVEYFHELHGAWAKRGVLTALEQLFTAAAPQLLALTDGERRMSNYLQLGELLADAEAECFGMVSVVRWLDKHVAAAGNGDKTGIEDKSQLRLESDANLVRISTVHAAKGLQYPIVFMPFALWLGTSGSPDKPPLHFHAQGQALIDLVGDDDANRQQAVTEARSEALRLLYVGLTRAKQALFVGWRDDDKRNAGRSALADLLHRDQANTLDTSAMLAQRHEAIAVEPIDLDQAIEPPAYRAAANAGSLTPARTDLPEYRPHWSTYSFSRLAQAAPATPPEQLPQPGAEDEMTDAVVAVGTTADHDMLPQLNPSLAGVRFGSAVHDILETWVGQTSHTPWPAPGQRLADEHHDFTQAKLRQYGLIGDDNDDPRITETGDLVARTLHAPLPDIGPLATLQTGHVQTEMGFMLRLGGNRLGQLVNTLRDAGYLSAALGGHPRQILYGLMQGFIDVVAQVDGRYYVLDYKTNNLGDTQAAYTPAALQRAIGHAHYDLQYLIYTVALHRHLRRSLGRRYDPDTHLGGVQYLFVRAMDGATTAGVFADHPDPSVITTLDTLFDAAAVHS